MIAFEQLQLMRPWWLLSLPILLWLGWRLRHLAGGAASDWQKIMDPELYQALSDDQLPVERHNNMLRLLSGLATAVVAILLSLALAGPSWESRETPVVERVSSRILLLDLSRSMLAEDIKPNRLSRAKIKLREMLSRSADGQTGLIVFAGDAYAIAPLTEDIRTLDNLVPPLDIDLMPSQGSRVDLALNLAAEMLLQTKAQRGQVVLLTDSPANAKAQAMATQLAAQGHRLDVLGFGSAKGAPIPNGNQGFVQKDGAIVFSKLDAASLRELARSGNGRFLQAGGGNSDIAQLLAINAQQAFEESEQAASSAQPVDGGVYFLLAALPFLLLGMRGRSLWLLPLLLSAGMIAPQPSYAKERSWWDALWKNADQQAHQQLIDGDPAAAVEQFDDPDWRAAADYQAGNYQAASEYWADKNGATALYNQGNALARSGDLEGALKAYQAALDLQPNFDDAEANASLIEELLKQQQNENQEGESGDESQDGEKSEDGEQGEQGEQQSEQSQEGQQQGEQQDGEQGESGEQSSQDGESQQDTEESSSEQSGEEMSEQDRQQMQQAGEQNDQQQQSMEQAAEQLAEDMEESEEGSEESQQAFPQSDEQDAPSDEESMRQMLRRPNLEDQATDQWLNRIEDNPAGLLRRKFAYEADKRAAEQGGVADESGDPW